MSSVPEEIRKLPLGERAFLALKEAARKVHEEAARAGRPVYIWKDGKVVEFWPGREKSRSRRARSRRNHKG